MTKDELTTQSPEDIRLQKCRSSLIASGGAMMLFALWTVLRTIVQIDAQVSYRGNSEALRPMVTAIYAVCVIDLILKLYVGMSARVEGMGREKKRPYFVLGIIIIIISLFSIEYMILEFPAEVKIYGLLVPIITMAVDVTALYAALDLVISAVRVRKLEQEMGRA